jgi:hypothetical protein
VKVVAPIIVILIVHIPEETAKHTLIGRKHAARDKK